MQVDHLHVRGLIDTNVVILRPLVSRASLPPREVAIRAVTLAVLSAGVHLIRGDSPDALAERARRVALVVHPGN